MATHEPARAGVMALLAEMLREAERVIDHQTRGLEELDDKSEQMIRLGVAALAGVGAAAAFAIRTAGPAVDALAAGLLAAAALLTLAATGLFVQAYVGFGGHREVHVGPDLGWLAAKANDVTWTSTDHLAHVLDACRDYALHNLAAMEAATAWRRWGLYTMLAGIGIALVGVGYILGRLIIA